MSVSAFFDRRVLLIGVATAAAMAYAGASRAADKAPAANGLVQKDAGAKREESKFIRLTHDNSGELAAMETAIVHYIPADPNDKSGVSVDLVAAVHVGEKPYYEKLNKQFEQYDALLYELVADKNTIPKPGQKGRSALSSVQTGLKDLLNLEFQLDAVDYTKKNFVHADMSPEEMAKSMKDLNESLFTIMLRMMGASMANQNGGQMNEVELIMALLDKNRAIQMKRLMAGQMENMEGLTSALSGPKGNTLINERNKAALKVLDQELKAGKKKIAIFYGGAHLPDMEQRLAKDFGLKRDSEQWLEAWNLRLPSK